MNQDIICIYYSRTGYTEHTMRELARALAMLLKTDT